MSVTALLRRSFPNFWKVFGSYVLLVSIALAVAWLVGSRQLTQAATQRIEAELEAQAQLIREIVLPRLRERNEQGMQELVNGLRPRVPTRFTIVRRDGVVLADSDELPAHMDNHANRPEILEAAHSGRGSATRFSATEHQDFMYVALLVQENGAPDVYVRASLSLASVDEKLAALRNGLLLALLASLAVALVASVVLSVPLDVVTRLRETAHVEREHRQSLEREIVQREKAEQERKVLIGELEKKNAELERYTYTVSHDLKSPLITIKGFLGYLEQDAVAGNFERFRADLARISQAADRMTLLLDDLLELSRVGRITNAPENVALNELAREAVQMLSGPIAARGVELAIEPDLPVVRADRVRLREVLQNLVENAVKFMGDQPPPQVVIGARRDGGQTVCFVRDNGIGIEPAYHQKVFGLFDKLDKDSEGTGIGLALVKRIIEVHGGRIWIESEGSGRGATFCFSLAPAGAPHQPAPATANPS